MCFPIPCLMGCTVPIGQLSPKYRRQAAYYVNLLQDNTLRYYYLSRNPAPVSSANPISKTHLPSQQQRPGFGSPFKHLTGGMVITFA